MTLLQARAECQRWLNHLEQQKKRATAMQQLAADRRSGKCTEEEGRRRLAAIDVGHGVTVHDGAKLAEAVTMLLKLTERSI